MNFCQKNDDDSTNNFMLNLNRFLLATPEEIHKKVQIFVTTGKINQNEAKQMELELINLQETLNLEQAEFEKQNTKYLQ